MTVIGTGGLANIFYDATDSIDHIDEDITNAGFGLNIQKKSSMEIEGININDNDLIFVPLGGSNEIGMNMNLYHFSGKWIIVDLGISFGDDTMPGVDVLVPTPVLLRRSAKT